MRRVGILAISLVACLCAVAGEEIEWDLSELAIVAAKNPKGDIPKTIEEIKYHFGLIAGSKFDDAAKFRLILRRPKDAPEPRPFESRYRIAGNEVWFWGDDGGSSQPIDFGDDRGKNSQKRHGTLFAVSLFLEKELGVKWLWPGEGGIEFTPRTKIKLPASKEASFESRLLMSTIRNYAAYGAGINYQKALGYTPKPLRDPEMRYLARSHEERADWKLRNRLQSRAHFKYGHAYTKWWDRFSKTHPEYLNWNEERKERGYTRNAGRNFIKLCVSNEAVVDQIVADWCAEGTNRYLNVCENDSGNFCQCANCRALDVPRPEDKRDLDHLTDRYCDFWNRIAAKARAIRPDVMLVTYAYARYRLPPRRERIKYPDNMLFGFVPSLMDDSEAMLREWQARGMKHYFLRPNYHHFSGTVPRGMERVLFDDFQRNLRSGMVGVDYDAPATRPILNFEYYVTARMVADPDATFDEIAADFYSGFGPAAADMKAYFELVRRHGEAARDEIMRVRFKNMRILDDSQLSTLQCYGRTEEGLREELALADAALKKWKGRIPARYADRIEEARTRAEHAILAYCYFTTDSLKDAAEYVRRGKELVDYRIANAAKMPDNWTAVFGGWSSEIRSWQKNAPYCIVECDGGTLDPRGVRYGWSVNFEGMSFGFWRWGDKNCIVTNDVASKGEWSCRLDAARTSSVCNDNLEVFPGGHYRVTASLLAEEGVVGAKMRVYAYPAPEKDYKGGNLVSVDFTDLPVGKWVDRSVEFVAPMKFPDERKIKYGARHYENVVPRVQALGGPKGSALHVDDIRVECIDAGKQDAH